MLAMMVILTHTHTQRGLNALGIVLAIKKEIVLPIALKAAPALRREIILSSLHRCALLFQREVYLMKSASQRSERLFISTYLPDC